MLFKESVGVLALVLEEVAGVELGADVGLGVAHDDRLRAGLVELQHVLGVFTELGVLVLLQLALAHSVLVPLDMEIFIEYEEEIVPTGDLEEFDGLRVMDDTEFGQLIRLYGQETYLVLGVISGMDEYEHVVPLGFLYLPILSHHWDN